MTLGYFPGCSLEGTALEFDQSLRAVAERLALPFTEIADWNCCGASAAHQTNHLLGLGLPARNLALAAEQGMAAIFAPCAACSNRLISVQAELAAAPAARAEVEAALGKTLPTAPLRILNCIEFFLPQLDAIKAAITSSLAGKRVACYYGCLLLRPPRVIAFDDPEQPSTMEQVAAATGAEPVTWGMRTECCGAAFAMSSTASVERLVARILEDAHAAGAAMVVTACPLCHANLDLRQNERTLGFQMPVLYLPQLIGLALGLAPRALGLDRHLTPVASALAPAAAGS